MGLALLRARVRRVARSRASDIRHGTLTFDNRRIRIFPKGVFANSLLNEKGAKREPDSAKPQDCQELESASLQSTQLLFNDPSIYSYAPDIGLRLVQVRAMRGWHRGLFVCDSQRVAVVFVDTPTKRLVTKFAAGSIH